MASEPDYGAVFIRLGEIAGGNRDKSAIGDLELTMELNHDSLNVENRESLGLTRQSHLPPCPMRNDLHRGHGLRPSARRGDRPPVLIGRKRGHTYPRSPAGAAASRASMLAISGRRPHSCGSRRRGRFECRPGRAGSERQIHRSRDPGHNVLRWDRFRHGASGSSPATGDFCEACFRWQRDRPKRATASWMMRASIRSGWAKAMRKPTGPP